MEEPAESYQVKLQGFEGPMELLLHLIKENRINIHDIPISLITRQYLAYLDLLQSLNLTIAGEFLVVAATLLLIKSRTLLPQSPVDEEEGEDPREDLVRRLLEYQKFRDASDQLGDRELTWREVFYREPSKEEEGQKEIYLVDLNPFDLLAALQKVIASAPKQTTLQFTRETLSVKDRIQTLLDRFALVESLQFGELFDPEEGRDGIIVTFLALLEVVRLGLLRLIQAETPDQSGLIRIIRTDNIAIGTAP